MKNNICVRRGIYLKTLMLLAVILFLGLGIMFDILFIQNNVRIYLFASIILEAISLGLALYTYALFTWRVRITNESIFVRVWYRGFSETEYKKDRIIIADGGVKHFNPNEDKDNVLGTRYVIWSKDTQKPITDVYDKDVNSEYIKEMTAGK